MSRPDPELALQYERYPYPARNPAEEDKRLVTGSPGRLAEIIHYVRGGQAPSSLKVLVAGCGTGDAAIMIAQQARDAGIDLAMDAIDLSDAALETARRRAARRGLAGIGFRNHSLLEPTGNGPYDYIDCCGVLHHLADPAGGLKALAAQLAPGGGIGLMVYGKLGREGVYEMQAALSGLMAGLELPQRLVLTKKLLPALPRTNGFRRNPFLGDHLASDAGIVDLLLHARDRAYLVPELADLVAQSGLAIASFIEPARYQAERLLGPVPQLMQKARALPMLAGAALAELLAGNMKKHICYLTREGPASVARPDGPDWVPVFNDFDGVALGRQMKAGQTLNVQFDGLGLPMPMPFAAGQILRRIDGQRTLGEIQRQWQQEGGPDRAGFDAAFAELYDSLAGANRLLLRRP